MKSNLSMDEDNSEFTFKIGELNNRKKLTYKVKGAIGTVIMDFLALHHKNDFTNKTVSGVFRVHIEIIDILQNSSDQQRILKTEHVFSIPIEVYQFTMDLLKIVAKKKRPTRHNRLTSNSMDAT